jgi:hypothetical protein
MYALAIYMDSSTDAIYLLSWTLQLNLHMLPDNTRLIIF